MMYPLVRELAADGIPVAMTCRVLRFSKQTFYQWRRNPVPQRDWDDAHLTNAAWDAHHDDPAFGYRFIADELHDAGLSAGENRVWRLCFQQGRWSVFSRKRPSARLRSRHHEHWGLYWGNYWCNYWCGLLDDGFNLPNPCPPSNSTRRGPRIPCEAWPVSDIRAHGRPHWGVLRRTGHTETSNQTEGPSVSTFQRILNMASQALDKNGQPSSDGAGKSDWRGMVRTVADKVTGDTRPPTHAAPRRPAVSPIGDSATPVVSAEDRAAISRYDYLLKTAQPEQLEQVHRDAFARLSLAQREEVNAQLRAELPAGEYPASSSPNDLARSATRGEAHNPGFLRKIFATPSGRGAAGAGIGAVAGVGLGAAGGLLAAVAGGAVLSDVAAPLLEQAANLGVDFETIAGSFDGGIGELTGGLEGGLGSLTGGLEGVTGGASEYATGLGDQLSELGSNFEIPGLSGLGKLFGRE